MPEETPPQPIAYLVDAIQEGDIEQVQHLMAEAQQELEQQNRELREAQVINQRLLDTYSAFFGALPMAALVVDRHGLIIETNQMAEACFGLQMQPCRHYLLRRLVHPAAEIRLNQALLQAEHQGHAHIYQIQLRSARHEDAYFPAELHIARLPGRENRPCEFSCAVVDLTERMRHEAALQTAHEQLKERETCYRIAADYSPDWDYWYGTDGQYVYVSPGCKEISGYPPQAFKEDPELMLRLLIPEDRDRWQHHLNDIDQGCAATHVTMVFTLRRPDGQLRHIEHQCQAIVDERGVYLGRRGVNRDITARKQAQDQLAQVTRLYRTRTEVNQAITRLEDDTPLLHTTARIAVEQGGFRACLFIDPPAPGKTPKIRVHHGLAPNPRAAIPLDTLWETLRERPWTVIHGHPLIQEDCAAPSVPRAWRHWSAQEGITSAGHFPLFVGDELMAMVSFLATDPHHFTPQVVDLLKGVMADLSNALHHMGRERQRKAREAEFQRQQTEARTFTQAIIDSLQANICVLDSTGTIIAVNRSWIHFAHADKAPKERVSQGMNYLEICDRAAAQGHVEAQRIAAGMRRVMSGALNLYEDEYHLDSATYMIRVTPLTHDTGQQRRLVISHLDITELKRNEIALRDAKEEAERASQAKSEFLSSMSHELRTPMNAVLGFAQLLEIDPALTQEQQEQVQEILRGGRHLLGLINQVLDLAAVESGRIELSLENVPLEAIMDECITLVRPLARERQIQIQQDCPPDCVALADPLRLKQIVINLLSNGIKYNRSQGLLEIRATVSPNGHQVMVTVKDTGQGIAPERMKELFQPFNRLDANPLETEGTGIGLAISRRLVETMDGTIEVKSEPGQGSTFMVHLPRGTILPDDEASGPATASDSQDPLTQAAHTILHIDDNPANIRLVAQMLRHHGQLQLLNSPNPRLGLELASAHQPDLILLDINMPELDGYQVLRQLRANPHTTRIPVIAVTAFATERDMARGRAAGFDAYLTKPLDIPLFLQTVDVLLDDQVDHRPAPQSEDTPRR
ncbi:PAS domain S-box-containing protein [Ectothiorhodospira magna]|uniref:histidine kinase n=1 Tax=Ectothiorhodospira magna TaxID=867345 RepID=A0A1H9FR94_9GAMM|nr:ATP-binding protein [Ectothiorhodospira magna]SEQ40406.1 PAS domain S-box-containing protein [Ectothiorhodospira magna]